MDIKQCIKLLGLVVLLFAASSARAQTDPYFQWMNAITDDTLTPRMAAHLNAAGIHGHEQEQVAAILSKFKAEEFGLEASYNNLPSTLNGQNDGMEEFYVRQAALVQRTIAKLKLALPASSFQHIDNRVQQAAKNIQTARVHSHPMLTNVAFPPQLQPPMNANYSLYVTGSMGMRTFPLTASMLAENGTAFPQWNAVNLVDGNTSNVGLSTDGVQGSNGGNAYFYVNFGSQQDIIGIGFYMSASGSTAQFLILYSDGGQWTNVYSGFTPTNSGYNYAVWNDAGAHQYWIVVLDNAPNPGPTINELQLIQPGARLYFTSQVTGSTSCPKGCSSVTHHGVASNSLGPNVSGPNVSPTAYINVSNHQSEDLPNPTPPPNPPVSAGGDGTVYCTSGAQYPTHWQFLDYEMEAAVFNTTVSALVITTPPLTGWHPMAFYCSDRTTKPDAQGSDYANATTAAGEYQEADYMFREFPQGTSDWGVPWYLAWDWPLTHHVIPPDFAPPDCTNYDRGYITFQNIIPYHDLLLYDW